MLDPIDFEREFMTAGAAAKEIGVSRQRIHALIGCPDFPKPHRFFNLLLVFRRREIAEWKEQRKKGKRHAG